jgi:hypothetical protein
MDAKRRADESRSPRRDRSVSGGATQPPDGGSAAWPEAPRPSSRGRLIAATAALPSPCSPSRQPDARGASRALTAPRGAGCWPPCSFGERSGPRPRSFTKRTWMQNAAPTRRSHSERGRSVSEGAAQPLDGGSAAWPEKERALDLIAVLRGRRAHRAPKVDESRQFLRDR